MFLTLGGRALLRLGVRLELPNRCKLRIPRSAIMGDTRRVLTCVVKRDKNPDRQLRSPNYGSVVNDVGSHRQPGGWLRSSHPLKKA